MAPASAAIAGLTQLGLALLNAWMIAAEQQGLSKEEAIALFPSIYTQFMVASAVPVDPVKE